jgi:hypothetical protein
MYLAKFRNREQELQNTLAASKRRLGTWRYQFGRPRPGARS